MLWWVAELEEEQIQPHLAGLNAGIDTEEGVIGAGGGELGSHRLSSVATVSVENEASGALVSPQCLLLGCGWQCCACEGCQAMPRVNRCPCVKAASD